MIFKTKQELIYHYIKSINAEYEDLEDDINLAKFFIEQSNLESCIKNIPKAYIKHCFRLGYIQFVDIAKLEKNTKQYIEENINWYGLLQNSASLHLFNKYDIWKFLEGNDWYSIVTDYPEYKEKCDEYNGWKLIPDYKYGTVIIKYSELAENFNGWKALHPYSWIKLFRESNLDLIPFFLKYNKWSDIFDHCSSYYWKDIVTKDIRLAKAYLLHSIPGYRDKKLLSDIYGLYPALKEK